MTNVIVAGAAGRMGARIMRAVMETDSLQLSGVFERPDHPDIGRDPGLAAGLGDTGLAIKGALEDVVASGDVIIDFSVPGATLKNVAVAAEAGKSMVIGTTGFSREEKDQLMDIARDIRVVMAPNMSIGVNLLFKIVGDVARILGTGYDLEIIETHHRFKKDAPSGTAVKLAEVLADATGRNIAECGTYGRQGMVGQRTEDEIAVMALRAGDIVGEHTVIYGGIGERIEITHRAHSRDTFARGAARAAAWVVDQAPGFYDMQDVLGLK